MLAFLVRGFLFAYVGTSAGNLLLCMRMSWPMCHSAVWRAKLAFIPVIKISQLQIEISLLAREISLFLIVISLFLIEIPLFLTEICLLLIEIGLSLFPE